MDNDPRSKLELTELWRQAAELHIKSARLTEEDARLRARAGAIVRRTTPELTIQVVGFDGCPMVPPTQSNLARALQALALHAAVEFVDQDHLPEGDERQRWQCPTLLVNGRDLFGLEGPSATGDEPLCRVYPNCVPTEAEIATALKSLVRVAD